VNEISFSQARETEISLHKWSGGTAHYRT